jgi:hypothetical protein
MIRHDHPVGSICKDVSPSRDIVPVYGQSPFDEEQQQTNILDFQTADVKLDGVTYPNE